MELPLCGAFEERLSAARNGDCLRAGIAGSSA